jgi:hypothetical protein
MSLSLLVNLLHILFRLIIQATNHRHTLAIYHIVSFIYKNRPLRVK